MTNPDGSKKHEDGSDTKPDVNPFVGSPGIGADHEAGTSDTDARIEQRRREARKVEDVQSRKPRSGLE